MCHTAHRPRLRPLHSNALPILHQDLRWRLTPPFPHNLQPAHPAVIAWYINAARRRLALLHGQPGLQGRRE
jgi:hypothetical protein